MSALQSFGNPSADSKSVPEAVAIFIEDTDRIVKAMPTDQDDDYAEVVETYSLYTAEDYQNPLWFLIKTVGYIILSPFVLIFHLLPKFLNWFAQKLCSALCNLCRLLCNGLLWCMSFFNKYMLTPFNTYVLTPICSGISWLCEITYNGIAWLCEKTYNGVVYAGSALHKYLLAPCYKYVQEHRDSAREKPHLRHLYSHLPSQVPARASAERHRVGMREDWIRARQDMRLRVVGVREDMRLRRVLLRQGVRLRLVLLQQVLLRIQVDWSEAERLHLHAAIQRGRVLLWVHLGLRRPADVPCAQRLRFLARLECGGCGWGGGVDVRDCAGWEWRCCDDERGL